MPSGGQKRPGKRWLAIRRSLTSPEMRPFRQDPRFPNPVTRLGLMEYWKQYGPLDDCELQGGKRFGVVDPQRRHHIAPKQRLVATRRSRHQLPVLQVSAWLSPRYDPQVLGATHC
jgi:hypothetical protein